MDPAILKAATAGDFEAIRALQRDDPRLIAVTVRGSTLLHVAARRGHEKLASWVGSVLPWTLFTLANSCGDTALHLAARAGHTTIVFSFLTRASREHHPVDALFTAVNGNGDTALHDAVRNRHSGVVRLLMGARPDLASVVNKSGESPLYLAAERASLEIVSILLESEISVSDGPGGKTALHAAIHRSYGAEKTRYNRQMTFHWVTVRNNFSLSTVKYCDSSSIGIAQMLLDKKPESSRKQDSRQSTPLHYAASAGDLTMVRLLLPYDTSVAYIPDAEGLSPIHVAAAMGHVGVIQELISTCPETEELIDEKGRNCLHFAVEKNRPDVVKYVLKTQLLEDTINVQDCEGNTALHLAIIKRNRGIVGMLLADKRVSTNTTNHKGFTPLDLACSCDKSYIGLRMYKIRQALVSAGSQLSPQRLDHLAKEKKRSNEEEATRCRAIASNLTIVAVLVATVTFAAAFTLPGGYRNDSGPDQGTAILGKKAAFKAFMVSDATAMVSSIIVIHLLIHTGSLDHDIRLHSISTSMKLMQVALAGMAVAFATGVYVVTAAECRWLAILICVVACGIPLWMHTPLTALEPLKRVKTCMEGRKAATSGSAEGVRSFVKKDHRSAEFRTEEGINVSGLLKLMGFHRTIDFQTPPNSASRSCQSAVAVNREGNLGGV